jgi:hypothetical protein
MAVVFDNSASITGIGVTTLTPAAFTITALANRAAFMSLGINGSISGVSGSVGGVAGVAIAGTLSPPQSFGVTAPPSGSQTATMSWTGAADAVMGVATASGVDQVTPFNNGTVGTVNASSSTVTITSTNGDLTINGSAFSTGVFSAPNQTQRWNDRADIDSAGGAGSTGPGTGTATHTWTITSTLAGGGFADGANFKQAVSATIVDEDGEWISLVQPA